MTNFKRLTIEELAQQFKLNSHGHFTGELRVGTDPSINHTLADGNTWSLYFLLGRLVWANSSGNRFRRWRRVFLFHDPKLYSKALLPADPECNPFWEYRIITALVRSGKIQRKQAIAMVEYLLGEVLFDILQMGKVYQQNVDAADDIKRIGEPITILNSRQLLSRAHQHWNAWNEAGLADYSPHLAPYISNDQELRNRIPLKSYNMLINLVDGQSTLSDIAIQVKQDTLRFTKFLTPLIRKGLMALTTLPDIVSIPSAEILSEPPQAKAIAKVLCIDDNPTICWQMENVLTKIGYACFSIQDPLQAIPTLLEKKPDLIFLDLVMPIASGYEICSQIRRISAFKDVPVIILTGNDGIVDRVRAKVVGASDFMAKPVNPQKVMEVVRRYCPPKFYEPTLLEGELKFG